MNYEALIEEIITRVMAKLQEMEQQKAASSQCNTKPCNPEMMTTSNEVTQTASSVPVSAPVVAPAPVQAPVFNPAPTQVVAQPTVNAGKELIISKRCLVERDVVDARREGVTCIIVGERTILTDLAKEYAANYGIKIVRD